MKQFNLKQFNSESISWFKSCLDPYHDFQLDCGGLPDERTAPSVVQVHNQSYSLTIPTSAAGGNWDASVLFTGVNTAISNNLGMLTKTSSSIYSYDHDSLSTGMAFGALNIWAGAAGATMSTGAPTGAVNETTTALGSVLTTDRCRLIGAGFEIHNTTAEIYRQGSLTVAQLPDCACDSALTLYKDTNETPWMNKEFQNDRCVKQASTLPYLLAVPGSQTWPAAEGVYCVPRMVEVPRNIYSYLTGAGATGNGANSRIPILYGTDGKTAMPEPDGNATQSGVGNAPIIRPSAPNGFTPVQVFLTGLSPQTTLTITFRTIVEYFPALDSALLPLASPSAMMDYSILQLYSRVIHEAPYAVPVGQNAAGDYFKKILLVISKALRLAGPAFGQYGPLAVAAGDLGVRLLTGKKK